jgi:hypothetical protein
MGPNNTRALTPEPDEKEHKNDTLKGDGVPAVIYGSTSTDDEESLLNSNPCRQSRINRNGGSLRLSLSQSLTSFMMPTGELFTFKDGHPTTIVADDEALPPQTALHGSSRSAANAFNNELRRIKSVDGGVAYQTSSVMSLCTIGSSQTVRTLKEIEEEYLAKTR